MGKANGAECRGDAEKPKPEGQQLEVTGNRKVMPLQKAAGQFLRARTLLYHLPSGPAPRLPPKSTEAACAHGLHVGRGVLSLWGTPA